MSADLFRNYLAEKDRDIRKGTDILLRATPAVAGLARPFHIWFERQGRAVLEPPQSVSDTAKHSEAIKFWLQGCSDYLLLASLDDLGSGIPLLETGIALGAGKNATWLLPSKERAAAAELLGGVVNIGFFDAERFYNEGVLSLDDTDNPLFAEAPVLEEASSF